MPNRTPASRRAGLDFAQRIAQLALTAPDDVAKKATFAAANWLRKHYGLSEDQRRDEVVNALTLGCSTYDDLVEETKIARCDVVTIVKILETAGDVTIRKLTRGNQGGRAPRFIALTEQYFDKLPKNNSNRE